MNWLRRLLVLCSLVLAGASAGAHEMSMAEMELRQASPNEFVWQWMAGNRPGENLLRPLWPQGCRDEDGVLRCGSAGLSGQLGMQGIGKGFSAVLVKVYWLDGQMRVYTITGSQTSVQLFGSADDQRGVGEIVSAYTLLGVEHILSGFDHLLFVIGLLFLVGFRRQLVWTITAFTAAHSLTLASASLGWLTLRSAPVEACIALSIVLVAAEALRDRQTLAKRLPALVSFLFGLVHGLGFAGALQDIGLPQNHLWIALLTFNVGVEAGQLMAVGAAWLLHRAVRDLSVMPQARVAALYSIGCMAAYWTLTRVGTILGLD
ncbi:MAG: HupE/UreJ family protein [Cytophagales bacterium]|nr:HupE/UreJ family protein [Rhizobacter sp.]